LQDNFDQLNYALYKEKEMADFRRCFLVLAALALLLATVGTVSAQNLYNCTSLATPAQMRQEGLTEKAGDFVLTCTGGNPIDPGAAAPTTNIQIFLSPSTVTSRILVAATNATEALLLIDEPPVAQQKVCAVGAASGSCSVSGLGASASSPYLQPGAFNVWQGALAGANSIVFNGVPIAPPGTMGPPLTLRITNIRANASVLAVSSSPLGVTETVTSSNTTALPIQSNNASQTVGFVFQGLVTTLTAGTSFQQCFSVTDGVAGTVNFTEGFAASWKLRSFPIGGAAYDPTVQNDQDTPGAFYNTETQYRNSALDASLGGKAGSADFATRLRVVFAAVQSGVTITVPLSINNAGPANVPPATAVANLITSEAGPYALASSGTVVLDSAGNGEAVYEIVQTDSTITESLSVPITVSYTSNPGSNIPALGTSTVGGSFAPVSTDGNASAVDPIPRFKDTSVPSNDFTINKCATHLLFPFVTNQLGFDTGLAISNTSQDPYGTSTQTGTCTLNWYGDQAPAATTTPTVAAGTVWASTVMAIAPNFQGYMFADCQFQFAHGFAFVTRVGAVDIAMGYLALIVPDPPRSPNPFDCPKGSAPGLGGCNAGSGEQLGL